MLNLLARISFVALVALPVYAQAETGDAPSAPDRNPFRAKTPATAQQPAAKPVLPGDQPTVAWSDAQVAAAKLDCAKVLSGVTLDYETLPPLKEGICGAPAPILVKSIGGVAIEPPATMTCALASGVASWISKTLQPHAKAILGTQVVKLHNATSYSCRNRYGGETTPLSEHALANALDISEFVFESGEKVTVLARLAARGESIRRNHGIGHAPSDCKPHGDRGRGGHSGQGKPRNESLCRDGQSQDQSLCGADGCREDAPSHAARRSHRSPNAVPSRAQGRVREGGA